jgi:hypothetical protein
MALAPLRKMLELSAAVLLLCGHRPTQMLDCVIEIRPEYADFADHSNRAGTIFTADAFRDTKKGLINMTKETIFTHGLEIASQLTAPESGDGVSTYQVGEHHITLTWKDGQVETADAQESGLETKVFRLAQLQALDNASDGDGGIEQACIKCWRVGSGPWRCIPITCPASF